MYYVLRARGVRGSELEFKALDAALVAIRDRWPEAVSAEWTTPRIQIGCTKKQFWWANQDEGLAFNARELVVATLYCYEGE